MRSLASICLMLGVILIAGGCATVEPWQKANLAKPAMTFSGDLLEDHFTQHIYTSKENASGGYGIGGGGCGCN